MKINHKQVTFAREFRGYSQTGLSSKIKGLSQSNLSKFEKGIDTLSEELIDTIIEYLNFPKDFFYLTIYNKVENAHFRKKASATKKEKDDIDYSIKLVGYLIDSMSQSIAYPEFRFEKIDLEDGYTPFSVAQYTRRLLSLQGDPVRNIFSILEKNGIIVVELAHLSSIFDGVSFFTDQGYPTVIINKNMSNDRKRFTLAHELGHIIMHLNNIIPEYRDSEKEAFEFAAEFLMPADEIRNQLIDLKIPYLKDIKQYWLTSMASIIKRAKDLKCISSRRYTNLNIELSRNGYKKKEPFEVEIDKPKIYKQAYDIHKNTLKYSIEDFKQAFYLPEDIIIKFLADRKDKLSMYKGKTIIPINL